MRKGMRGSSCQTIHVRRQGVIQMSMQHVSDYGPAPLDVPEDYPGRWPEASVLMAGECVWPITERSSRRLEQSSVEHHRCELREGLNLPGMPVPLSYALLRLNATQMSKRRPFLAVGSNANPAQLHKKLSGERVSDVVPMTIAEVLGLGVGFSEHITTSSPDGTELYVPTTILRAPSHKRTLLITWFDIDQEKVINQTERNYVCVIAGEDPAGSHAVAGVTITLNNGELLQEVVAYESRWGARSDDVGEPILLPNSFDEQVEQQKLLKSVPPRQNPSTASDSGDWQACATYSEQGGISGEGILVRATSAPLDRRGDSLILVSDQRHAALGKPTHVVVQALGDNPAAAGPGIVVRVKAESSPTDPEEAQLDQVPRNALGVEVGERVSIQPLPKQGRVWGDLIVPDPIYTYCRIQAAPLVSMERDIVIMDPLAMSVVGVETGDEVVIEGVPSKPGESAPRERLRVVPMTEQLEKQRMDLVGGGPESRYPSALIALGVWPDLPWIFMDQSTRQRLNLGQSRVAAVRVRASRRDLLVKEARELLLLLVLAAIGVLTLIGDWRGQLVAVLGVVAVGLVVVLARLRRKIAKGG
jgi:hypothetical protein